MMNPGAPAPNKMSNWTKVAIILGVLIVGFFVVCIGAIVAGGAWFKNQLPAMMNDMRQVEREARDFGRTHTQADCAPEALRRNDPCGQMDIRCAVRSSTFLTLCLRATPQLPTTCANVPPTVEIMRTAQWRADTCATYGRANDQRCPNLMAGLQNYCMNPRPLPERSLFDDGGVTETNDPTPAPVANEPAPMPSAPAPTPAAPTP